MFAGCNTHLQTLAFGCLYRCVTSQTWAGHIEQLSFGDKPASFTGTLQNTCRMPAKGKQRSSFWEWGNSQQACLFLVSNVRSLVQHPPPHPTPRSSRISLTDGNFLLTPSFFFSSPSGGRCPRGQTQRKWRRRVYNVFRYQPPLPFGSEVSSSLSVLLVSDN